MQIAATLISQHRSAIRAETRRVIQLASNVAVAKTTLLLQISLSSANFRNPHCRNLQSGRRTQHGTADLTLTSDWHAYKVNREQLAPKSRPTSPRPKSRDDYARKSLIPPNRHQIESSFCTPFPTPLVKRRNAVTPRTPFFFPFPCRVDATV